MDDKVEYLGKKVTDRQMRALEYLNDNEGWVSPTEIGGLFGGHSSTGSPICLRLVELGLVERNDNGFYRAK